MLPVAAFPSTPLVESTVLSTLFSPWVYNKNAVICIPEDYPMSGVTLHCQDRLINLSIVTERCFLRGNIKITKIIFLRNYNSKFITLAMRLATFFSSFIPLPAFMFLKLVALAILSIVSCEQFVPINLSIFLISSIGVCGEKNSY